VVDALPWGVNDEPALLARNEAAMRLSNAMTGPVVASLLSRLRAGMETERLARKAMESWRADHSLSYREFNDALRKLEQHLAAAPLSEGACAR
jgi:hypothetical protein